LDFTGHPANQSINPGVTGVSGKRRRLRRRGLVAIQLFPIIALVVAFLFVPLAGALWSSFDGFSWDFSRYRTLFQDPVYAKVLFRSLQIAAATSLLCVVLGYPITYFMTTLSRRQASLFSILLLVPLFTAFLIRTYGWMVILGRRGVLNTVLIDIGIIDRPLSILGTSWAVYVGLVHVLMPIAIFIMYASMSQLDRSLLKASEVLGAHPVRAFLRVYLPMSLPAIISASVLTFIMAIGFYITPVLLGGPAETMISQLVVTQVTTLLDFQTGYALAISLLAVTLIVLAASNFLVPIEQMWALQDSRQRHRSSRRILGGRGELHVRAGRWLLLRTEDAIYSAFRRPHWLVGVLLKIYIAAIVLYLLAPLAVVYILSFSSSQFLVFPPPGFSLQWYQKFFLDPQWRVALLQSLKLAAVVASISVAVAAGAAFALVRGNVAAKRALFLFILAPLLLPMIVLALGLYVSMGQIGLLGSFAGLVIGHLLFCAPYAVVILVAAVRNLDRNLEYAAATLGGSPPLVFRKVVLPTLAPALIAAWLMAFLQSFDELLITLFLLGRQEPTLPIKMWSDIRIQLDPTMSAASSAIVTMVILIILATQFVSSSARTAVRPNTKREGAN
jgi:putative spermidine/putrescine transport system permease protein